MEMRRKVLAVVSLALLAPPSTAAVSAAGSGQGEAAESCPR